MAGPGPFRHRVTFQAPAETQDPYTGAVEVLEWEPVLENVPAEVGFRSVRESVGGAQMQLTTLVTVTLRWQPGITAKQRIVWQSPDGERVFNITGAIPDGTARTFVEIPVVELV